jgi:beta-glucosidase
MAHATAMLRYHTIRRIVIFLAIVIPPLDATADDPPDYLDDTLPIDVRVESLLARMTLEEKVAQLQTVWAQRERMVDALGVFHPDSFDVHFPYSIGQLARPNENPFAHAEPPQEIMETVEFVNALQRHVRENTRLGIPVLLHEEALHGLMAYDATSFPQAIALAGTWNRELVERIYTVAGIETRARGSALALTPVLDVARDARWGRVEETFGEDPYLVGEMGLAAIWGFQGRADTIPRNRVASTLKHFVAHGEPEGGMNAGPADFSERIIREIHLYPFRVGIQQGNPRAVMPAYHEIDGIPLHASRYYLHDVLREELQFEGVTVADYGAIRQMYTRHYVSSGPPETALMALTAGVDMEMPEPDTYRYLTDLVRNGELDESYIDRSVRRVLRLKFELGLFEDPFADAATALHVTGHPDHVALAREAAEESLTLLQNRGQLAPFSADDYPVIAVIGPNADKVLLGSYSGRPKEFSTVLDGIRTYIGDRAEVRHAEGPKITERDYTHGHDVPLPDPIENRERIRTAIETARDADLIVLALGGNEQTGREGWASFRLGDRADLSLLSMQDELVDAIAELGIPAAAFVFGSRPLALGNLIEKIPVVFQAWYLGQETGAAIARVLFGETFPGGRLAISFPRSAGHIPAFYNHKPQARRGYLFDDVSPLFPFGYGLAYTDFSYSPPELSHPELGGSDTVTVSVSVTNTGGRTSSEVVQLYIRNPYRSVTRPVRELKDFTKIVLRPGETKTVSFEITAETFAFYNRDMKFTHEPGESHVMIGRSSDDADLQTVTIMLTE